MYALFGMQTWRERETCMLDLWRGQEGGGEACFEDECTLEIFHCLTNFIITI